MMASMFRIYRELHSRIYIGEKVPRSAEIIATLPRHETRVKR